MAGLGASMVRKRVDPRDVEAISSFLSEGGEIKRVSMSAHGECLRPKGIRFGNGVASTSKLVDSNYEQTKRDLMSDPSIRLDRNTGRFIHE